MKNLIVNLLGIATALLLGSCQDDPEPAVTLFETRWMLTEVDSSPIMASSFMADNDSYLQFVAAGGTVQGLSACDAITGKFELARGTQQLTISQVTLRQGSCSSPVVGGRYLAALPQTVRYEIEGRTLRLYDASAVKPRLVFLAAQ